MVTSDQALLWTDGRYHLQAAAQLDCNWTLMKQGLPEVPSVMEWLKKVHCTCVCLHVSVSDNTCACVRSTVKLRRKEVATVLLKIFKKGAKHSEQN